MLIAQDSSTLGAFHGVFAVRGWSLRTRTCEGSEMEGLCGGGMISETQTWSRG
jgi:hypothetical protein